MSAPSAEQEPNQSPLAKFPNELWSVPELLIKDASEGSWIIEGLLKRGGQMLLAAPPKSGKSLLASEIAVALAKPFANEEERYLFQAKPHPQSDFPGLRIHPPGENKKAKQKPRKSYHVLFASLEMEKPEVADRISKQIAAYKLPGKRITDEADAPKPLRYPEFPLVHLFGIQRENTKQDIHKDLEIVVPVRRDGADGSHVEKGRDVDRLEAIINALDPDVIIFDTLIQLHEVNENDNVLMKGVMRAVRKIATRFVKEPELDEHGKETGRHIERRAPIAHIVLHHTRKENTTFKAPLSADIMRGAGAVHGVADLVMLARQSYKKGELEIHISSRSSSIPNFWILRNQNSLVHTWQPPKTREKTNGLSRKVSIFREVFLGQVGSAGPNGLKINPDRLNKSLEAAGKKEGVSGVACSEALITKRIDELRRQGFIKCSDTRDNPRKNAKVNLTDWRFSLASKAKKKGKQVPQKKNKNARK